MPLEGVAVAIEHDRHRRVAGPRGDLLGVGARRDPEYDGAFAALADPTRLLLLSYIASADGQVCACDLLEPSGRSQPTVSHHMKILVDAGLVTREKRSLWVWYHVIPERLEALRSILG